MSYLFKKSKIVLFFVLCSIVLFGSCLVKTASADYYNWAENTHGPWFTISSNTDGSKLILGGLGSRLYLSSDGGDNWTETQPAGDATQQWQDTTSSMDGQRLIAQIEYGGIYISTDGGSTWNETIPDPTGSNFGDKNLDWAVIAASADAQTIIAGSWDEGKLYMTKNGGTSWTLLNPIIGASGVWRSAAVSADGQKLIAAVRGGRAYMSTDGGDTWTETRPAGDVNKSWYKIVANSDFSTILASDRDRLYLSSDGGDTWAETRPAGDVSYNWYTIDSSANGKILNAAVYGGRAYISFNGGNDWAEAQPLGATDQLWRMSGVSYDGKKQFLDVDPGVLYIGTLVDTTVPVITLLGDTPITIKAGTTYEDAGATAEDNIDGNITPNIDAVSDVNIDVPGTYTVTYNVSDAAHNPAEEVVRTIEVVSKPTSFGYYNPTKTQTTTVTLTSLPPPIDCKIGDLFSTTTGQSCGTTAPTTSEIQKVTKDLKYGMTDSDVKTLQLFLIAQDKGPAAKALAVVGATGYFGGMTKAALAEWQKTNGVTPSVGYFGQKTRALIRLLNL